MNNSKKTYLPEACCKFENLCFKDVKKALSKHQTVVGFVESINETEEYLLVRLGSDLFAYMPFSETTIYPFTYPKSNPRIQIPHAITSLRNKVICAKVKCINGKTITLSRKDNMLETYEAIKDKNDIIFNVTAVDAKLVFGDIGQGIQAKIIVSELCKSRIRYASEFCKVGQNMFVKVLNFDELKRANVSYKRTFPKYDKEQFSSGQVITGRVNEAVDKNLSGFYITVSPQVVGILDYYPWHPILHYGDTVECIVRKSSDKGLRLRFLRVIHKSP